MFSVPDPMVEPVKPITLRDQVYEQIRQAILEKRLKPGDHVREQHLTEMLQVSRTPLREALGLLERDGLVRNYPNRGWFVTTFTVEDIKEVFVLRAALESLAADLMIHAITPQDLAELQASIEEQRQAILDDQPTRRSLIDMQFHERLVALAGNQRLLQLWRNVFIQCAMAFNYHTVTLPNYDHTQGMRDHNAILDALRSGDPAQVRAVHYEINERVAGQCIEGYLATGP